MKRTTTAEATRRPPARGPRISAQASAARIAAAAFTMALLIAGCTAPQETAPPQPVSTESTGTESTVAETAPPQPPTPAQPTTAPVPGTAVAVRPATPQAQTPKDPAPRFLTVAGTTISMPIVEVGVSPDGAMEIPEPFNEAGWYRFGPAPGAAAGTAVVAAHVDTTSDTAPFSQLKSLEPGTLVTVQRDGAAPVTFRVTGVELMAKDAFDGASIFRRDGPPELKLVTCGGRWLDEQQDYGDNVIVTAVPA
ncbi:MAG TPA: class F sortase [Arthrobacter sp.]|nr:class F sortase [Arthrobacter sp.]